MNLQNAKKDQSQIILRNEEGVFVLTPALNKSFRFQSDWPQNSSQAYLYESLVRDILQDKKNLTFEKQISIIFLKQKQTISIKTCCRDKRLR